MTAANSAPYDREDARRDMYGCAGVYGPVFWVVRWMMRLAIYGAGVFRAPPPAYFEGPQSMRFTHNRQLRRAQAACLRRIARLTTKGRFDLAVDGPLKIAPRIYAHFAFANIAARAGMTQARFMALYAREGGGGHARVFGLSSAHEILAFIKEVFAKFSARGEGGSLPLTALQSLDAQAAPAPP